MAQSVFVFRKSNRIMSGDLAELWPQICIEPAYDAGDLLVFDEETGSVIDISPKHPPVSHVADPADTAPPRRGRPKLGVVSREVTLLPRHWDWLSRQRGGASAALRRLADDARKAQESSDQTRQRQEAAHKFMTAMAGDLPNFEEALRSLYRGDAQSFDQFVRKWPDDIRSTATQMAFPEG